MNRLSLAVFSILLGVSSLGLAQINLEPDASKDAAQGIQQGASKDAGADTASGASGTEGTAASGAQATPIDGNKALDGNVRGKPESASTSDRATSRNWTGVGSTGGGTGTGTSSGTAGDSGTSASGSGEEGSHAPAAT